MAEQAAESMTSTLQPDFREVKSSWTACLMSCTTRSTKKRSGGNLSTEVFFKGLSAANGSTLHQGQTWKFNLESSDLGQQWVPYKACMARQNSRICNPDIMHYSRLSSKPVLRAKQDSDML